MVLPWISSRKYGAGLHRVVVLHCKQMPWPRSAFQSISSPFDIVGGQEISSFNLCITKRSDVMLFYSHSPLLMYKTGRNIPKKTCSCICSERWFYKVLTQGDWIQMHVTLLTYLLLKKIENCLSFYKDWESGHQQARQSAKQPVSKSIDLFP